MDYQLEAIKNVCANVGPRNKKRFWNPPMDDMPITEENGRVTIVINTFKTSTRSALVLFLIA